jgi:hypothetical protein
MASLSNPHTLSFEGRKGFENKAMMLVHSRYFPAEQENAHEEDGRTREEDKKR